MNLVLSYGDLSRLDGYRTRVIGELLSLDRTDEDPFLLVFDRNPAAFERSLDTGIPRQVILRSAVLQFYKAIAEIVRRHEIKLVHAHNLYSASLALSCRHKYGYKVVLDYHGRIPEEYVFLGKGGSFSRKALELLEQWCVRKSDHVIVVSQRLGDYLVERYRTPTSKISVIPCCTDAGLFHWDRALRTSTRRSLNVDDKFVCTHLGRFSEWYPPVLLLSAFNQVLLRADAHLLVVTPDIEDATGHLESKLPRGTFTVLSAERAQVPALLNASDLGFLLLRAAPNIKTSSPVKFAEYLNCGLPVLISDDVGDYSQLAAAQKVGATVDENVSFDTEIIGRICSSREEIALHCQEIGRDLTWDRFSQTWSRMLSNLST